MISTSVLPAEKKEGKGDADYIGPTRAAISIIYMLK